MDNGLLLILLTVVLVFVIDKVVSYYTINKMLRVNIELKRLAEKKDK